MTARRQAARTTPMRRGFTHWISRLALAAAALAVLAMPFYAGYQYYVFRRDVHPQVAPVALHLDKAVQAGWHGDAAKLPETAAPVVLTYHDINPKSDSPYIVTPEAFDEQLTALEDAGYRTLTTEEFVAYLHGSPAPPRSVYMTFDDGTGGLWVYGDRILAKHHMHAASFLITGARNRPYYLSWEEISRMAASGRWDFQDHTHNLHWRGAVDTAGTQASALANRLWLPAQNRNETVSEYQARVGADLAQSLTDFADHGLPKPLMFAYPFSEINEKANLPVPGPSLQGMLEQNFVATLTDVSSRPLPAGRRSAGVRQVQRLEVYRKTTAKQLLAQIGQWTLVPPVADAPLTHPELWVHKDGTTAQDLGALTGTGPYPSGKDAYAAAEYLPLTSADWNNYTATASVAGLAEGNNVNLVVRNGSAEPISIGLSRSNVSIKRGATNESAQVATKPLVAAATHDLQVTVTGSLTKVLVDGRTELSWTSSVKDSAATGGVALSARSDSANWPKFASLKIAETEASSAPGNPTLLPVAQAVLLDPGAAWESAPGVSSSMKVGGDGLAPQGLALSDYAAYEQVRTSGWTKYTVRGTVGRLNTPQVSGAIWVRVGSPQAVSVEVSRRGLRVLSGSADARKVVATKVLADADHHDITVTVGSEATWITVDGTVHLQLAAKGETGGVAFSSYRDVTRHAWPTARSFKVTPAEVR